MPQEPVKVFIAYARKDEEYLNQLRTYLRPLERNNSIDIWYDGEIVPGSKWDDEIKKHLHSADIILLLVSANSLASDYFYEKEMTDAIVRHERGEAVVIPVILSSCLWWEFSNLKDLQALPKDAKPISKWNNISDAYTNVANGLDRVISGKTTTKTIRKEGKVLYQIPNQMQKEVTTLCRVRIAPVDVPDNILKQSIETEENIETENIRRVGRYMKVNLTDCGDENFTIKNKSTIEQFIEDDDYTEWLFDVTPVNEGKHCLQLTVSVTMIRDEFGKEYKDVIVLDKEIEIIADKVIEINQWTEVESGNLIFGFSVYKDNKTESKLKAEEEARLKAEEKAKREAQKAIKIKEIKKKPIQKESIARRVRRHSSGDSKQGTKKRYRKIHSLTYLISILFICLLLLLKYSC